MSDLTIDIPQAELKKLDSFFKKYDKRVTSEVAKEVDRTAFRVLTRAKNDCPVNTGRLYSSLHVKTSKNEAHPYSDKDGNSFNGTLDVNVARGQAFVGTNVEYADDVESGRVRTKNGRQPFLAPAVRWEQLKFIHNIKKILRK